STVHHHPIPARTKSNAMSPSRLRAAAKAGARPPWAGTRSCAEAIKRSGGPGELGGREAGLSLVLDAEGVDTRACRLGDREVRRDRVEHARKPHGLTGLDREGDDVLDLAVDRGADAHAVTDSVVPDLDCGPLDAEHLSHQRREPGHRATESPGEHLHELVRLLFRR